MDRRQKKLLEKAKKRQKKENRESALERYRKKKRKNLLTFAVILLLIAAAIGFLYSPFVKLKNINVSGYYQATSEEILEAGGVNNSLKTWSIKDDEVAKKIKDNLPIAKEVKVKSKMLSTITIEVEEYKLIAKNKKEDGSYETIMENGLAYEGIIRNSYSLPVLEKFTENKDTRANVYRNLAKLNDSVRNEISEIINNNDEKETITIYMKDGLKIKALAANFADKLNYYDEMASYIKDKSKVTLNLVNGAYVETDSSIKEKEKKTNELLAKINGTNTTETKTEESSNKDNKTNSEKSTSTSNSSSNNTTSNVATKKESTTSNTDQATTTNEKKKYTP